MEEPYVLLVIKKLIPMDLIGLKPKKQYQIELAKTLSGHWYSVKEKDKLLGYFPSSTTILLAFPQSLQLTKWIADNGWHESQRIKSEAGIAGTKIHTACDLLEEGVTLYERDYFTEEWVKIESFVNWFKEINPKLIAKEMAVFSKKYGYAGKVDRIYKINNEIILLDFKSGNHYNHHPLQFSSYAQAFEEMFEEKIDRTAALYLGASNKDGYRFVQYPEWKEHFKVFKSVQSTWNYENFGSKKKKKQPPILNLPSELKL